MADKAAGSSEANKASVAVPPRRTESPTPTQPPKAASWSGTGRSMGSSLLEKFFGGGTGSPPLSPKGGSMRGADVWLKGTGVTSFQGNDRYDKVEAEAATNSQSVDALLAPFYQTRGPPSWESKESYEKGTMRPD